MTLVRLGRTIVNFDAVTCVRDLSTRAPDGSVLQPLWRIEFANRECVEVSRDADELNRWLSSHGAGEPAPT